jgi:hypothetical protein
MPLTTTTIDEHGQPHTVQAFDHEAFAAWKIKHAAWHRTQYAANAGIRAARKATNAAAYRARKARKLATAETK